MVDISIADPKFTLIFKVITGIVETTPRLPELYLVRKVYSYTKVILQLNKPRYLIGEVVCIYHQIIDTNFLQAINRVLKKCFPMQRYQAFGVTCG
jgi:hypothetical protein